MPALLPDVSCPSRYASHVGERDQQRAARRLKLSTTKTSTFCQIHESACLIVRHAQEAQIPLPAQWLPDVTLGAICAGGIQNQQFPVIYT